MANLNDILATLDTMLEKYDVGGVTTTGGFAAALGQPSANVLLTDGINRKKKNKESIEKFDLLEKNVEEVLEKCDVEASTLIKGKKGVWRRINGRPCFICKDGVIHAGPPSFKGKKAATLKNDLKRERSTKKFKKRFQPRSEQD